MPDIEINHLIQTHGQIFGVDFTWDYESTLLLQASQDFQTWTNVAYIWSYPPETSWITNQPLNIYGQFFRVAIVAGYHSSNLPPLNSILAVAPKVAAKASVAPSIPCVTGCNMVNGNVVVSIVSQTNQTCDIQALDSHRHVLQTQQVTSQGTSATTSFDAASLPSPVFFQAVAAK